jgi:hypothetical protein
MRKARFRRLQVDLKTGHNRFYKMQLLQSGSTYALFTKWGRTGESFSLRLHGTTSYYGDKPNGWVAHCHDNGRVVTLHALQPAERLQEPQECGG